MQHIKITSAVMSGLVTMGLVSSSVFGNVYTWDAGGVSANWTTAENWNPDGAPTLVAGDTVDLSAHDLTANGTSTADGGATLGILNIGDVDGTHTWTLNGGPLTFDNSGSGAQINQTATSAANTISASLILGDDLTIANASDTAGLNINGGITGTGDVILQVNGTGSGNAIVSGSGANFNNTGAIINSGTGNRAIRLQGGVGANVNQIVQNSATSVLLIASPVMANASGTTIISNNVAGLILEQGVNGAGNVIIRNNGAGNITLGGTNVTGTVTHEGTGPAGVGGDQVGTIGSNVTEVIQNSATADLTLRNGVLTIHSSGSTILTSTGGAKLYMKQGSAGTGDLILHNNSGVNDALTVAEQTLDHVGKIINSGTSGRTYFADNKNIGPNITGIEQSSAGSSLLMRSNLANYVGVTTITAGTIYMQGPTGNYTINADFIVGDTAAHAGVGGAGTVLDINVDSNNLHLAGIVGGFGRVQGENLQIESGGTLRPGDGVSAAVLTFNNNLMLNADSNLDYYLNTPLDSALGMVHANLTLAENLTLAVNAGSGFAAGTYYLLDSTSAIIDNSLGFTGWSVTGLPSGYTGSFLLTQDPNNGNANSLALVVAIPEPATMALLGLGCLVMLGRKGRGA